MKLNRLLGQIISAPNFDHFSAVELRAAYITLHPDKNLDPSFARRFVYAEIVKLLKKRWLRKTVSKKKEIATFIKTAMSTYGIKTPETNVDPSEKRKDKERKRLQMLIDSAIDNALEGGEDDAGVEMLRDIKEGAELTPETVKDAEPMEEEMPMEAIAEEEEEAAMPADEGNGLMSRGAA